MHQLVLSKQSCSCNIEATGQFTTLFVTDFSFLKMKLYAGIRKSDTVGGQTVQDEKEDRLYILW